MAFNMDELHRRKAQREQQRQERLQQQKKLMFRLAIAGGVLVAVAVLILAISFGAPKSPDTQTEPPVQTSANQGTAQATETTTPPTTVVRFTAVGDLNVTEKVVASGGPGYDYTNTFMDVLPVLSEADLTVVNLEGTLCGAPYGTEPDRSAPQTMLTALVNAGVDLVQTANSYTIKKGVSGMGMTLANLRVAGLESVGAYATQEEYKKAGGYTIRDVNGVKVAVVGFTKGMDGMALPVGSEDCVNLLYTDYASSYRDVDEDGIKALLRRVEKEKPDMTIALVHWGSEYNDIHSDSQAQIRQLLLEQGVDAIIGTHPHYVQELEYDPDKGTVVAYSLGDFISDAERSGTEYSIALHLEITKDNTAGTTKITNCSYTPLYTAVQEDGTVRVVRLEAAMRAYQAGYIGKVNKEAYSGMEYALQRIQERVNPTKE